MGKSTKYHLAIEVDKLTNSIVNLISGDSFSTEVNEVTKADLKMASGKNGWLFDWAKESKFDDKKLFKLSIKENANIIQGLISISDYSDHCYVHLIESAPY